MNNEIFKRVQIVKEVISPMVEFINIKEVHDISILKLLREQVDKCNKKVLHGLPKLNKFLTIVDTHIEQLNTLLIDGIDNSNQNEQNLLEELAVDADVYEEFYDQQIEDRTVKIIQEDSEDFKMFSTSNGRDSASPRKSISESNSNKKYRGRTRSSRMNDSQKRAPYNSANNYRSRATGSKFDSGLGKISELNESDYKQRGSGSSSERPKKVVKFDLLKKETTIVKKKQQIENAVIDEIEEISDTSFEDSHSKNEKQNRQSSKSQLTKLSKSIASKFLKSKQKTKEVREGSSAGS